MHTISQNPCPNCSCWFDNKQDDLFSERTVKARELKNILRRNPSDISLSEFRARIEGLWISIDSDWVEPCIRGNLEDVCASTRKKIVEIATLHLKSLRRIQEEEMDLVGC
jgi:hypothetical protein